MGDRGQLFTRIVFAGTGVPLVTFFLLHCSLKAAVNFAAVVSFIPLITFLNGIANVDSLSQENVNDPTRRLIEKASLKRRNGELQTDSAHSLNQIEPGSISPQEFGRKLGGPLDLAGPFARGCVKVLVRQP